MSMSRHPLDPLHERLARATSPVTVLRKAASPSVVDLESRADALTSGQMSVVLCQAKDDHPHEDDHHYLETDQVAPEPSTESLHTIQQGITGESYPDHPEGRGNEGD